MAAKNTFRICNSYNLYLQLVLLLTISERNPLHSIQSDLFGWTQPVTQLACLLAYRVFFCIILKDYANTTESFAPFPLCTDFRGKITKISYEKRSLTNMFIYITYTVYINTLRKYILCTFINILFVCISIKIIPNVYCIFFVCSRRWSDHINILLLFP